MFYKVCPAYRVIYCMLFIVVVFYLHCKAHLNALRANLSAIEMLYYYYNYNVLAILNQINLDLSHFKFKKNFGQSVKKTMFFNIPHLD